MTPKNLPIANPQVMLREEFDDWAVLFDPDTGNAFGLNPISVLIWKCLNGRHTIQDTLKKIITDFEDVPEDAESDLEFFIKSLVDNGLAGYEIK